VADTLRSEIVEIGSSLTTLLQCPAAATAVIHELQIGHVDDSSSAGAQAVSLALNKGGAGDVYFVKDVTINPGELVTVFSSNTGKLTLEVDDSSGATADILKAVADAASTLVAVLSYVERT
jgi:hypothetical protein